MTLEIGKKIEESASELANLIEKASTSLGLKKIEGNTTIDFDGERIDIDSLRERLDMFSRQVREIQDYFKI